MSILTSEAKTSTPAADAARTPRWSDARDQMIHASALQEHIIASGPSLPSGITVNERVALAKDYQFSAPEIDLDVHLHPSDSITEFQLFLGGDLRESPRPSEDGGPDRVLRELLGEAFGCSFRVWLLANAVAVSE